jgi:ribulose-5-phosphate 4-epimerase/fuculose-1-phosphate aldolase
MTMYRRELLSLGVLALVPQIRASAQAQPADLVNLVSDLVAGNHILASENIVDGYGHISVRHPANKDRFLLSRSLAPESVTPADVLEYGLDGEAIDPKGKTSYKERFIHSEIYRARPDVNAVVHCHAPSLIPFGVTRRPLRPMYHQSAFLAAGVPVFEIRDAGGMTNMLVETAALGRALAKTLADKPAVLMRGHGAVVVADSIPTVVGRSIYLELNARIQAQAIALGGPITEISAEEARKYAASDNYARAWELWKKKAK